MIRLATVADAWVLTQVQLAAWQATYDTWIPDVVAAFDVYRAATGWVVTVSDPTVRVAVAEVDGTVRGYAVTGPAKPESLADDDDPDAVGELYALYVHPAAHGRGLGRALVADALAAFATAGRKSCVLWAIERDPSSRDFYEHLGFRLDPAARLPWNGLDQVRYRRLRATDGDPPATDGDPPATDGDPPG